MEKVSILALAVADFTAFRTRDPRFHFAGDAAALGPGRRFGTWPVRRDPQWNFQDFLENP